LQDQTLNGLCNKAKSTHPIGAIETTLLGPAAAAEALAEREQLALEDLEADEEGDAAGVLAGSAAAGEEADLDNTAVLRFVNEWLSAVADAAVGLLLAQIARIETLSKAGAAQLVTDLEYLRYNALLCGSGAVRGWYIMLGSLYFVCSLFAATSSTRRAYGRIRCCRTCASSYSRTPPRCRKPSTSCQVRA
jgi:hypothetical protein